MNLVGYLLDRQASIGLQEIQNSTVSDVYKIKFYLNLKFNKLFTVIVNFDINYSYFFYYM
jgi:hypothetical protein